MATARGRNRATFPCRERPRHGTATISVLHPGVAEFDRVGDGLSHPRALGAQLQGKGVRRNHFCARASWLNDCFASTYL